MDNDFKEMMESIAATANVALQADDISAARNAAIEFAHIASERLGRTLSDDDIVECARQAVLLTRAVAADFNKVRATVATPLEPPVEKMTEEEINRLYAGKK